MTTLATTFPIPKRLKVDCPAGDDCYHDCHWCGGYGTVPADECLSCLIAPESDCELCAGSGIIPLSLEDCADIVGPYA